MKNSYKSYSDEELKKHIDKQNNKVKNAFDVVIGNIALMGISLFVGLPVGLLNNITWLTILSSIMIATSVLGQAISFIIASKFNNKLYDLQKEQYNREVLNVVDEQEVKDTLEIEIESNQQVEKVKVDATINENEDIKVNEDVQEIEHSII